MVRKITMIGQARMGASRLPGKVLQTIQDKTALGHIITRVRGAKNIDDIIIATTTGAQDDAIVAECERYSVTCFRGSEADVLGRFFLAAQQYGVQHIMRVCCDNPLIDCHIIDASAALYANETECEYVRVDGMPTGLGVEIFPFAKLANAHAHAKEAYQREHVTPYIIENSTKVKVYQLETDYTGYRFTMDTEEDFQFITEIYKRLYKGEGVHDFFLEDIVQCIEREPELLKINQHIKHKKIK